MASTSSAVVPYAAAPKSRAAGSLTDFASPDDTLATMLDKFSLAAEVNVNKNKSTGVKLHGSNVFIQGPRKLKFRVIVQNPLVPAGMVDSKVPTGVGVITKLNDYDSLQAGFQLVDRDVLPVLDAIKVRIAHLIHERRADLLGDSADLFSTPEMILAHLMKKAGLYKLGGLGRTTPMLWAKAKGWASTFVSCDVESYKGDGRGYTNAVYIPRSLSTIVANSAVFGINLYDSDGNLHPTSAVSVRWLEDDALASTAPVRRNPDTGVPMRRRVGPQDVTKGSSGTLYVDFWGINLDDKHSVSFLSLIHI